MKTVSRLTACALAAGTLFISSAALATNGYFTHGVGAESKGMAGTGVGSNAAQGAIISATNPALSVFADDKWEVGLGIFSPMRSYTASPSLVNGSFGAFTIGEGSFDSGSEWFPIPYVAKKWTFNNGNALSAVFYGRGGMNTDWEDPNASAFFDPTGQGGLGVQFPGTFGGGKAGVDLSQAFLMVSYAGRTSDRFAWGIGPVFAVQMFEANGLASFAPFTKTFADCFILQAPGTCDPTPTSLTNNGHDLSTGFGFAGGIWFGLNDYVSAGLAYQSKMSMGEFDDYSDLFAEGGGFDIPSSLKFGLSFQGSNNARLNLDVEHTQFSEVNSVGNPMANIAGCPTAGLGGTDFESCLGGGNGAGFGWDDMTTYKVGVEIQASETSTWRFGYSYGEQPIQSADVLFNILAPGVMEQHFTLGMTRATQSGGAWTFSLMYAPSKSITGVNMFDPTQTIELEMKQLEFEVAYLW
ncbi:MAG TPA: outer membrane protein transport protein [Woeseiaceae bacterium]